MLKQYYAIHCGDASCIVHSWEECEPLLVAQPGAQVVKFYNLSDALLYLSVVEQPPGEPVVSASHTASAITFFGLLERYGLIPPRPTGSWWRDLASLLHWWRFGRSRRP